MRRHSRKVLFAAAALGTLACAAVSQARDYGQYSQVPQTIRQWVESLVDGNGIPCCATADGTVPDEFTWDIGANHYRVKVYGQWVIVPDSAVIKGSNRLGHAVVWIAYQDPVFEAKRSRFYWYAASCRGRKADAIEPGRRCLIKVSSWNWKDRREAVFIIAPTVANGP